MTNFEYPNKLVVYDDGTYRVVLRLRNNHNGFAPWLLNGFDEVAKCTGAVEYKGHFRKDPMHGDVPKKAITALQKAWSDCKKGRYDDDYKSCVNAGAGISAASASD